MNTKPLFSVHLMLSIMLAGVFLFACASNTNSLELKVEISNDSEQAYSDLLVQLDEPDFIKRINETDLTNIIVKDGDKILASQVIDLNGDNKTDQVLVLCDINAHEKLALQISTSAEENMVFEKRTQAEISVKEGGNWEMVTKSNGTQQYEYQGGSFQNTDKLRVPDEHTDHSFYIRYEGPGWESDKVGYRFYLDWRNATDIFGKKTSAMVLQKVGQDGFESYHEEGDWGMDILKVGSSLGIGSIGYWDGEKALRVADTDSLLCTITENGAIYSAIETNYFGWSDPGSKLDLQSLISIEAGSKLSAQSIKLSGELENICTGIVKNEKAKLISSASNTDDEWSYMATWGKQSLNNDNMGMVVYYKSGDLIDSQEDEHSHILVLKPVNNTVNYYFGAVWEKDSDGISTEEQYLEYLNTTLYRLNNPISIKY